jgi:hypothetical protein
MLFAFIGTELMYLDPRVLSLVKSINYGGCRASILYFLYVCGLETYCVG